MSFKEEVKKYEEVVEARLKALVKDEYKQYILDYLKEQDKPCSSTEITNNVFGKIMDIRNPEIGPTNIARASANMNVLISEGKVQLLSNKDLVLSEWSDRIEDWEKQLTNSAAKFTGESHLLNLEPDVQEYRDSQSEAVVLQKFLDSLQPIIAKAEQFLDLGIEFFKNR